MRKSAPVTLPVTSLTSSSTRSATSSGRLKRPVTMAPAALLATSSGLVPVACPTLAATPSAPSHRSAATGPGLTVLTRTPLAPTSFDSALEKLARAAFAALLQRLKGQGLQPRWAAGAQGQKIADSC